MIIIALGANLSSHIGAPSETLHVALTTLRDNNVMLQKTSRFYESPAWPDPDDPVFVNAVAQIETARDPSSLMALLHDIETSFGRLRGKRNAPRTLDLDLIDYDGRLSEGPPVLPHPRMDSRGFVLIPLAEIVPSWRHPANGHTVQSLIANLPRESRNVTPI